MRKLLLGFMLVVISAFLVAGCSNKEQDKGQQAVKYKNWNDVAVTNLAKFQIPPTLEVQNDTFRNKEAESFKDKGTNIVSMLQKQHLMARMPGNVVCQVKGLNDGNKEAEKTYAKVVFNTIAVKDQKVPTFGRALGLKQNEIQHFGEITKEGIIASEKDLGTKVTYLKWDTMKSEIVNGVECLLLSYDRQIDAEPVVHVDRYTFFNTDKIFIFTIEARTSEKEIWHSKDNDIDNIVNTLSVSKGA